MAQYDFGTINPSTKSGTALAGDLNDWRTALNTNHSGNAAPSYQVAGMMWLDSTTNDPVVLKYYDGADQIIAGYFHHTSNLFMLSDEMRIADPAALTKRGRFDVGSVTAGQTRVGTFPDRNFDISKFITGEVAITLSAAEKKIARDNSGVSQINRIGALTPFENLKIYWASNSTVTITADACTLFDVNGNAKKFTTLSVTLDITTTGAGGRDTGSEAADTWYYIRPIGKEDGTLSCELSTVAFNAPTLPTDYIYWGTLGAVRNNSSSNFLRFLQRNLEVVTEIILSANNLTATSFAARSMTAHVPVEASIIKVTGTVYGSGPSVVSVFLASHGSGTTATYGHAGIYGGNLDANGGRFVCGIPHFGAHEFYYYVSGTSVGVNLSTNGWTW